MGYLHYHRRPTIKASSPHKKHESSLAQSVNPILDDVIYNFIAQNFNNMYYALLQDMDENLRVSTEDFKESYEDFLNEQLNRVHRLSHDDKLDIEILIKFINRERFLLLDMETGYKSLAIGFYIKPNGQLVILNHL